MSKAVLRSIKNVTNGYTSAQVKVRNATSNDPWGPSTADMEDIAQMTFQNALTPDSHELFEIMDMIDRRLNDKGKNWRHVMKALTLLDYIIHAGSENVVLWSKDNLYVIKTLREFQYVDEAGRDQGANIRAKAREITSLLQDDDRLREERSSRGRNHRHRRPSSARPSSRPVSRPPVSRRGTRTGSPDDDEIRRAMEESRLTAEEDERRRREMVDGDEDLRKAIMLSKEEEQLRGQMSQNNILFDNSNGSQGNLIDTSDNSAQLYQQQQAALLAQQQQQQQPQFFQQQSVQTDMFGNPVFQDPMSTGMLQNAYVTGQFYPQQQQPMQTGFQPQVTGAPMQQQFGYQQQQQQPQQEPQPLQPLKTGSNNPFAKLNNQNTSSAQSSQPSLSQLQYQQQQQQQQPQQLPQQPQQQQQQQQNELRSQRTNNFDQGHMNELNTLLSTGDGIDTFGNVGDLRIPAQHTKSTFVNSAGMGLQTTGNNNPFMPQQYTGVATTNKMQPAFTGYGFGNAQQSQQSYQQRQQTNNNLIDL